MPTRSLRPVPGLEADLKAAMHSQARPDEDRRRKMACPIAVDLASKAATGLVDTLSEEVLQEVMHLATLEATAAGPAATWNIEPRLNEVHRSEIARLHPESAVPDAILREALQIEARPFQIVADETAMTFPVIDSSTRDAENALREPVARVVPLRTQRPSRSFQPRAAGVNTNLIWASEDSQTRALNLGRPRDSSGLSRMRVVRSISCSKSKKQARLMVWMT